MKFVVYYINKKEDRILGAAAMGMMNQVQIINEAMRNGVMPKASSIKEGKVNLEDLLNETRKKNPKCTRCTRCSAN